VAKLSKEQWKSVRKTWENDPRKGHQWLADEFVKQGFDINRAAIAKAASRQGWTKNTTQNVTKSDKKSLKKVTHKATKQPSTMPTATPVTDEAEWEEAEEDKRAQGRPTKYEPVFDEMARKVCLLGATDAELAGFLEVDEATINRWKIAHPSFRESLKKGKMFADANAADSLYHRAIGYSHPEEKVFCNGGEIVTYETIKHYPPDTSAAFIWLKNRRPKDWRDKHEIEVSHKLDPDMLKRLETEMIARMEASRERQRSVLIERGIVVEE
jgi:hypothetical protein